jgi:hypothetical protein
VGVGGDRCQPIACCRAGKQIHACKQRGDESPRGHKTDRTP